MLILTRRAGETIRINDDISVTVLSVSGQQARLGITAPESVEVHREEIYQRIQAEKTTQKPDDLTTEIPVVSDSMHIDDRVKMAANAKRYEWLRNVAATTGSGHTPMVKVAGGTGRWRTGEDLDQSIDQAMRAWPGQQDEEQQPCVD